MTKGLSNTVINGMAGEHFGRVYLLNLGKIRLGYGNHVQIDNINQI